MTAIARVRAITLWLGLGCMERWAEFIMVSLLALLLAQVFAIYRDCGFSEPAFGGMGLEGWVAKLDGPERQAARLSISNMGPSGIRFLLYRVKEEDSFDDRTVEGLTCCSPDALPILLRALRSPSSEVRLCSLRSIQFLCPNLEKDVDAVVRSLARLVRDPNGYVRFGAVQALGRIAETEKVIPILIAAIRSEGIQRDEFTPYVKRQAAFLLGTMGLRASAGVSEVSKLLADPDPRIQKTARVALLRITESGSCSVVGPMVALTASKPSNPRDGAVLGGWQGADALIVGHGLPSGPES